MKKLLLVTLIFAVNSIALAGDYSGFVNNQIKMLNEQRDRILTSSELKMDHSNCEFFVEGLAVGRVNAAKSAAALGENPNFIMEHVQILNMKNQCGRSYIDKALSEIQHDTASTLDLVQNDSFFKEKTSCQNALKALEIIREKAISTATALEENPEMLSKLQLPAAESVCH
jgi:hypothetical protein